nr:unnamed protein product [Callosobruchus analis]
MELLPGSMRIDCLPRTKKDIVLHSNLNTLRCVMSMKRLAILSAIHNDGRLNATTEMNPTPASPPVPVHGVNIMLGG